MPNTNNGTESLWKELPPKDELEKLMGELDEAGLREFQMEVLDTVYASVPDERFTKVLRAWHRSLRFLTQPGFREKLETARQVHSG